MKYGSLKIIEKEQIAASANVQQGRGPIVGMLHQKGFQFLRSIVLHKLSATDIDAEGVVWQQTIIIENLHTNSLLRQAPSALLYGGS